MHNLSTGVSKLFEGRYGTVLVVYDRGVAHIRVRSGVLSRKIQEIGLDNVDARATGPYSGDRIDPRKGTGDGRKALSAAQTAREARKKQKRRIGPFGPGPVEEGHA